MPDAERMRLAKANRLHQPELLTAQVNRMLKDQRAETLGTLFAGQWLEFKRIIRGVDQRPNG